MNDNNSGFSDCIRDSCEVYKDDSCVLFLCAGTSCQPLQQLLKRLCCQLADLAAPTALTIVR